MKRLSLVLFITMQFFSLVELRAEVDHVRIDTINIYKDKCGVDFDIYMHTWFYQYGIRSSFGYNPQKLTHQDSIVIVDTMPKYFRVYDSANRLVLQGQTENSGLMVGDVIFYYHNGNVRRIEHWNRVSSDSCSVSFSIHEAPGRAGTWKYFRKDGTIRKELVYKIIIKSCEPLKYRHVKSVYGVSRKGRRTLKRTKVLWLA